MRGFLIVVAVLAFPGVASAQVFKCVKGKETVYQSDPCEAGQTTEKAWQAQTYAPPSNSELWRIHNTQQATAQRDAELRGNSGYPARRSSAHGHSIPLNGGSACDAAKRHRDAELRRLGEYGRKIEVRRSLDSQVNAACGY